MVDDPLVSCAVSGSLGVEGFSVSVGYFAVVSRRVPASPALSLVVAGKNAAAIDVALNHMATAPHSRLYNNRLVIQGVDATSTLTFDKSVNMSELRAPAAIFVLMSGRAIATEFSPLTVLNQAPLPFHGVVPRTGRSHSLQSCRPSFIAGDIFASNFRPRASTTARQTPGSNS